MTATVKPISLAVQLKRDLRRLFRSMDFVSQHPPLERGGRAAERFAEIYQQLGLAWEFLALPCRHRSGWRELPDGKAACKVCGTIRELPPAGAQSQRRSRAVGAT